MSRMKGVLSAAHMFAIGIIVVLSLSVLTYPIGFLASADIATTSNAGSNASGIDSGGASPTTVATAADSSSDSSDSSGSSSSTPPSDSSTLSPPSDSSSIEPTDTSSPELSSDGSTTTSDSSGGNPTGSTASTVSSGTTGNDSTTANLGAPSSDATPPSDSSSTDSTDSTSTTSDSSSTGSSDGSSTSSDSSGGSTEATGNESSTVGTPGGSSPVENQSSSSLTESSPGSVSSDDLSTSGPSTQNDALQAPETSTGSLSASTNLASESAISATSEGQNAVTGPIGDGQTVSLGDVSNTAAPTASDVLSFDRPAYAPGDSAEVTVHDSGANVDPNVINTVQIVVGQTQNDPGTTLTLTETEPNSGEFVGTFVVNSDASRNTISYDASHPHANVVFNGVAHEGRAQLEEVPVASFVASTGEEQPEIFIGNAVQLTLVDEAQLGPNSDCDSISLPPPCGGSTTVTISYANAPLNTPGISNQDPSSFTIWQYIPGFGWVDLGVLDYSGETPISVDQDAKTVTATSPFGPGVFVIGARTGGAGGGGGGAGLPGAGLILDLVAPLVDANSGSPGTTEPSSTPISDSSGSSTAPVSTSAPLSPTTSTSNVSSVQESLKTTEVSQSTGAAAVSSSGVATVAVPGVGNVIVSFTKLVSDPTISVSAVKTPAELSALKIVAGQNGQGTLTTIDNTQYTIAGNVLVVGPLDTKFDGTATVTVPYDSTLAPQASEVKLLYYTGSSWEDVTSNPPADGHVVTGSLTTLGPVVPAIKAQ